MPCTGWLGRKWQIAVGAGVLAVAALACGRTAAPERSAGTSGDAGATPRDARPLLDARPLPDAPPPPPPAFETAAATAGQHWPVVERAAAIAAGVVIIERHQCTRCHTIDGLPGAGRPYDCVSCHTFLLGLAPGNPTYEKIAAKNGKDILDRYIANIVHLTRVPDLTLVGRRVRPAWIAGYLAAPHDIRPVLEASMIRNKLTADDIRALARYFAAIADVPDPYGPDVRRRRHARRRRPAATRIASGKRKFVAAGCPSCHVFGNIDFGTDVNAEFLLAMREQSLLSPNLRFARERLWPEMIVEWILDPQSLAPGTKMPTPELAREDAELIRVFLLYADPGQLARPVNASLARKLPPPASHDVTWADVKHRVLGKVCVHCHMNDHEKDTGPGNLGGLGFARRGLSFRTYERSVWGAADDDGKRYSVFEPLPGETLPRILEVVVRRRVENRRDYLLPFADRVLPSYDDGLLGMPMGLPALTDEEIGILRKWIEVGCPGPTEVTGRPGFTDGFLVPDGPIEPNSGCELRTPSDPSPPWSSAPRGG